MRGDGRVQLTVLAGAIAGALALGACGRGRAADEGRRTPESATLRGAEVVTALRAPAAPGRILYDPPTDLSYANAARTRPDLTNPDRMRPKAPAAPAAPAVPRKPKGV